MERLLKISVSDFKLIFRDNSLRAFLIIPFFAILVASVFLPYLDREYVGVGEYVPYILMAATLQTSVMFGFIYSMVLIEEKETGIQRVYGVLPISKIQLITFRIVFPTMFAAGLTFVLLALQPFYQFGPIYNLCISLLGSSMGPILALLITNYSSNKMSGLTWYKILNLLINLPLLTFFIPVSYKWFFSWIPSYWIYYEIYSFIINGPLYLHLAVGYFICILLLLLLTSQFSKKHFQ